MSSSSSVLILDNFPQTLAVVRSLGRAGYHTVLGREHRKTPAEYSRFCHEVWHHPPPGNTNEFSAALEELLDQRPDIRCVFPVTEISISAVLEMKSLPQSEIDLAMVKPNLYWGCLDKAKGHELAEQAGLLVPRSKTARSLEELSSAAELIGFPIIVKPEGRGPWIFGRKAHIVASLGDLQARFARWPEAHDSVLVQEYIAGSVESSDFVAHNGILVGYCEARSLRTDMPDGTGFGVEFETIPPSKDILSAVRSFARCHSYSGPGIIQFIRSSDSGKIYFLENNPRLSAGVADSVSCGQNMPLLALQSTSATVSTEQPEFDAQGEPYEVYHRAYWLQRDLEGLLRQLESLSCREGIRWIGNIANSLRKADSHINWQLSDPKPSFRIYTTLARRFLVTIFNLLRNRVRSQ